MAASICDLPIPTSENMRAISNAMMGPANMEVDVGISLLSYKHVEIYVIAYVLPVNCENL
jgi:hypothetical protein